MSECGIELVRDEVSEIITHTKDIVADFRNKVKFKRAELPDIIEVKRQLDSIKKQLDSIKSVTDSIKTLYDELEEFLDERQVELQGKNFIIITERKEQLISLIHGNLPDNMNLYELEDNENAWDIVLSLIETREHTKKKKKVDKKYFYEKDEKIIGEIILEETSDELLIKVKIQHELNYQEFKIENPLRVFPIVNHIITRYNYNDEIE